MSSSAWRPQHVHIIGVGGIGMSGVANLLVQLGCLVTASELRDSPLLSPLRAQGVDLAFQPRPELAQRAEAILLPAGVAPDHPERRAALAAGRPELSRDQALLRLFEDQPCISTHALLCRSTAAWTLRFCLRRQESKLGHCIGAKPRFPYGLTTTPSHVTTYAQLGSPMLLELGDVVRASSSLLCHSQSSPPATGHCVWPQHPGLCLAFTNGEQTLHADFQAAPTHARIRVLGHSFLTPPGLVQAHAALAAISFAHLQRALDLAELARHWPEPQQLQLEGHFDVLHAQPLIVHEVRTFPAAIQACRDELELIAPKQDVHIVFRPYPFTAPAQLHLLANALSRFQSISLLPDYPSQATPHDLQREHESPISAELLARLKSTQVDVLTCDEEHAMQRCSRRSSTVFVGGDDLRRLALACRPSH